MMAIGSGDAIRLKLYVMAPIWTPSILELIVFAVSIRASGSDASATFPISRLVSCIVFLSAEKSTRNSEFYYNPLRQSGDGKLRLVTIGAQVGLVSILSRRPRRASLRDSRSNYAQSGAWP